MKKLIFILALSSSSFMAHAEEIPGEFILQSFKSTCTSIGNWTELALNDSRALMQTLENLKDDEDCKSVSGAISQLGGIESKLSSLNSEYVDQIEIAKLEAQEIELMSQIANVSDANIVLQLEDSLRQIQLDKAGLIAGDDASKKYNATELKGLYTQLISSTSSAYSALASNEKCIEANPNILMTATSLAGSIAAASSVVNPALGLGMATVSDFIGRTVNYFRDRGYNRSIRNIADGSTVLEGFKCAMESLSNRWCQIADAEKFLEIETSIKRNDSIKSELNVISQIFDRDAPVLLNWLESVKAGAPASNTADASRRETIFYREATLRAARSRGEGLFSENKPLYDASNTDDQKYSVIKSMLLNIQTNLDGRGSNPLKDIHNTSFAPFYLLGLDEQPKSAGVPIDFVNFNPFRQWPTGSSYTPNFNAVIERYLLWMEAASRRVNQELNQVLQPDPLQVLSTYFERTSNSWKQAPQTSLQNIIKFIEDNRPDYIKGSAFDELYQTTIDKLQKIDQAASGNISTEECNQSIERSTTVEDILDSTYPGFNNCDPQRRALEIIFDTAQLEFGSIVFKNRIETIVRVAIDEYITQSDNEDRSQISQLLAADSFLDVLQQVSGKDNKTQLKLDLASAKKITLANMNSFSSVFGGYINNLMLQNNYWVNDRDPLIAETYKKDRAKVCFLLTSLPRWPNSVKWNYCYGYKLESLSPGGPETVEIDYDYIHQPFSQRQCEYRNYIRHSDIYERWGIKL